MKALTRSSAGMIGLVASLLLAACAPQSAALPSRPVSAGAGIVVQAAPAPLNPNDPADQRIGAFAYAGGLVLTSDQTSRLHGLSDLKVTADGHLLAIGDEGDLLEARLALDAAGRPAGLKDARLSAIVGEDGQPLSLRGKKESDSEGIAVLANGDRLVSLEEDDRILVYPRAGGPPRRAPMPDVKFPFNQGMEALAAYPSAGPDAYIVGGEASGETWVCRLSAACVKDRTAPKGAEYGLTAIQPLPAGRLAYLLRAFDPVRGARITLRVVNAQGGVDGEFELARPRTVDNFEGLAAIANLDGSVRFYLISDDNFSSSQRTLLLAFDWRPTLGK